MKGCSIFDEERMILYMFVTLAGVTCCLNPLNMLLVDVGGGQYGDVYEGLWKRYNKIVAVKTLKVSCMLFSFAAR